MKGVVEELLAALRITGIRCTDEHDEPYYHSGKSCAVYKDDRLLGTLGELHPEVLFNYDLGESAILCDLDVEALLDVCGGTVTFKPLSRYPDVQRDSAFLVDADVTAQDVFRVLDGVRLRDLEGVELFDVYAGKGIPEGKKSLAIRASYRALDRTLTDEQIQNLHGKIVKAMQKELDAELR